MAETHPVIKKLQFKDFGQPVLILNAPASYGDIMAAFQGEVHQQANDGKYDFIQVFGVTNENLQASAIKAEQHLAEDGLFWLLLYEKIVQGIHFRLQPRYGSRPACRSRI